MFLHFLPPQIPWHWLTLVSINFYADVFESLVPPKSTCLVASFYLYYYMIFTWPGLNEFSFEIWLWPTQKSRNYSSKRKHETPGLVYIVRITGNKCTFIPEMRQQKVKANWKGIVCVVVRLLLYYWYINHYYVFISI